MAWRERGREGGRKGERVGGREGGRKKRREGGDERERVCFWVNLSNSYSTGARDLWQ